MPTLMDTKTTGREIEAKRARLAELEAEATTLGDSTQAAANAGNVEEYVRLMARQAANPHEAKALRLEITQLRRAQIAERIAELNEQQPRVRQAYEKAYRQGEEGKLEIDRQVDHAYSASQAIERELTRLTQESQELAAVLAVSAN
jgi:predicted  nucleic acid-binding Zn-ribbon protein